MVLYIIDTFAHDTLRLEVVLKRATKTNVSRLELKQATKTDVCQRLRQSFQNVLVSDTLFKYW